MTGKAIMDRSGRITLPKAIREQAGLEGGEALDVEVTGDGILLRRREEIDEDHDPADWRYWSRVAAHKGTGVWYTEKEFEAALKDPSRRRPRSH